MPVRVDGQWQVIGYMQNALTSFDLGSGKVLWKTKLSAGYDEHSAWPIYREPDLWITGPFQSGSQRFTLSGGDRPSAQLVSQSDSMSNDVSSSVLVGDFVYGFDLREAQSKAHRPSRGSFKCIDFVSGDQQWSNGDPKQRRDPADPQVIGHASVIAADGKLILLNDTGDLILLRADPTECQILARATVLGGEIGWSTPALDRGRVFVRNHSRAVCVFVGQPERLDAASRKQALTTNDIPQHRQRDWSALLGVEPEYAMDPPTRVWLGNWYLASAAILLFAAAFSAVFASTLSNAITRFSPASKHGHSSPTDNIDVNVNVKKHATATNRLILYWSTAMALGLVVGFPASLVCKDFIFTWPVCLYIAFEAMVYHTPLRRVDLSANSLGGHSRKASWITAVIFLTTSASYFLVCRRLSLVTQWMFLCGFIAALPVIVLARYVAITRKQTYVAYPLSILAFTAYYGLTAYLLHQK